MSLTIRNHRRKQFHLPFGLQHGLVRPVQVVEMVDQGRDTWLDMKRLKHVAAYKVGQVTHRLHGDRLMEQLQRLFILDAKAASKPGAVGRKAVEQLCAESTQLLSELGYISAEIRKILCNRQSLLRADKETRRLGKRILHPENLRQGHRLEIAGVMENTQDHRIAVVITQRNRLGSTARLIALGLVMAEHIGSQRALLAVGAGGLVVDNALRRHQQGGDRIHQG